ncbi:MAG: TrbG/VirB9 family P-type conjugative transfer protein [Neisseriaceae bacterium]|nr:TrbG/VirB9 family P-type conjugative transfer protein [Neisseriaceae bacterium]
MCLIVMFPMLSISAVKPIPLKDGRIKSVLYDPNDVVQFTVQPGRGAVIEFDPKEEIIFVNNGHAEAWEIGKKNNMLYIGAKGFSGNTNLIVQTDKRQYFIDLIVVKKNGSYKLKYTYDSNPNQFYAGTKPKKLNYYYYGYGDGVLTPLFVYDDGYFTYFKFRNSLDTPVIYKMTPDGSEALLDSHIEGDRVVIHETAKEFRIRLGKKVLGVVNKGPLNEQYNRSRTSSGQIRKVKK